MDLKVKSNNELLALMIIHQDINSDTYRMSYTEFVSRCNPTESCKFSDYEEGSIAILNQLLKDLRKGDEIDEEYWNEAYNMGINSDDVERYESILTKKEQEIGIYK
jgi:hypothetical protein